MALPASDNFTGSNGTTLTAHNANWVSVRGTMSINTNAFYCSAGSGANDDAIYHWTGDTFDDDQYSQIVKAAATGTYTSVGIVVRSTASGGYTLESTSSTCYLGKWTPSGDIWTQIGSDGDLCSVSDTLRLEAEGTTLRPQINGTTDSSIGEQTDATFGSGVAGLYAYESSTACRGDTWEAGNLTTPIEGTATNTVAFSIEAAAEVGDDVTVVIDDAGTSVQNLGRVGGVDYRLAQSFIPPMNAHLTGFTVYLGTLGGATNIGWEILADDSGIPDTSTVLDSGSFTPTGNSNNSVTVATSPADGPVLQSGTSYWLKLELPIGTAYDQVYYNSPSTYIDGVMRIDFTNTGTFPDDWTVFFSPINDVRMSLTFELLPIEGTATPELTFSITAEGTVEDAPIEGTATPELTFGISATGTVDVQGTATPELTFGISATGTVAGPEIEGEATPELTFGISSTGTVEVQGTSAPELTFSISASGTVASTSVEGEATPELTFSVSAAGTVSTPSAGETPSFIVQLDTFRDGTYTGVYDDITAYITSVNWRNGMSKPYDEVSQPARATFVIQDNNGDWRQDWRGSEALTNGDFADWTSDNPDSWTVTGESGGNPAVNEVGASQLHGDSGTGYCNLFCTTGGTLSISQTILTVGSRYEVTLNINTLDETLAGGLYVKSGTTIVSKLYSMSGRKTFSFTADSTTFKIETFGAVDITLESVSVKPVKRYFGVLNKGTLMRVTADAYGVLATTMYIGQIVDSVPSFGEWGERTVTITAECPMLRLLDANYQPELLLNTTVDRVIAQIFDGGTIPYPYAYRYWMLGVEGCSNLGVTTTLYDHAATNFDAGITVLPFTGDAENQTGKGVVAQGVVRSMMAAELGRFYWDTRAGYFTLVNRHQDILNDVLAAAYTFSDFEKITPAHDDTVNHVTVTYQPRAVGQPGEIIWSAGGLPIELKPGDRKEFSARYVDPDSDKPMGAMDFILPTMNADYIATTRKDGSGENVSNKVTMSAEFGGSSAKVWVDSTTPCFLQTLQLRGTPLRRFDEQEAVALSGDSFYDNDWQYEKVSIPTISDADFALGVAQYRLSRYSDKMVKIENVSFIMGYTATLSAQMAILRAIGDRITISDAWTQHDRDYFIVGEEHQITPGSARYWNVRWILRPASREVYWRVGVAGYSELGETTRVTL